MAKQYRVNAFVRINNVVISSLLRRGVKVGSFSLLAVRGRKSENSSLEEFEREAHVHPIFLVQAAS
jgi:hypothetical protein